MSKYLIDLGADFNAPDKEFQNTPSHIAASNGFIDCINLLSDFGANLKTQNRMGYFPIHQCIIKD
jgi:ankyrin repeat protein